jgi:riboflavin kinase/FMN adenylyltransferase
VEFIDRVSERFDIVSLVIGPDFAFGRDRTGDIAAVTSLGEIEGFAVRVVTPLNVKGKQFGSRHVRRLIESGDIDGARRMLRAPPRLVGMVVHGAARGRTLGFPTANLDLVDDFVVPANGIYTVRARWHKGRRDRSAGAADGLASIGVRPTFDDGPRVVEIYLLDFTGDLYGSRMTVDFLARQRAELRFDGVDELVTQMHEDVATGRNILAAEAEPGWATQQVGKSILIEVRGRDVAELAENSSAAVQAALGLIAPQSYHSGEPIELSAGGPEPLVDCWLQAVCSPLSSESTRIAPSTVFLAEDGVLHGLVRHSQLPQSRPAIKSLNAEQLEIDTDGWQSIAVKCELA